jgi:transposase
VAAQKKSFSASERDEQERARWRELVERLDATRLLFVDECGTHTSMTRTKARAPKGKRAYDRAPRNRGSNTTLIASMSLRGMGEAMAFEGATDKEVFEAYMERFLAPTLLPGQVVVLDNLGAHKGERVHDLVEARGASLLFLPTYSPDFSPIEEAFSKIKALLKKEAARTRETLVEAIGKALDAVTPEDAEGWFANCEYETEARPL